MRQQNQSHTQILLLDSLQHFAAIRTGIESHGGTRDRIPDEIGVHCHVAIVRVELGETLDFADRFRAPFSSGQFAKGSRIQFQNRSGTFDRVIIKVSVA